MTVPYKTWVTFARQTVVDGKVVAAVTERRRRLVYTRADGTEYILVKGKRHEYIKGLALTI